MSSDASQSIVAQWELGDITLTRSVPKHAPEWASQVGSTPLEHWRVAMMRLAGGSAESLQISVRAAGTATAGGHASEAYAPPPPSHALALSARAADLVIPPETAGLLADVLTSLAGRLSRMTREEAEGLADAVQDLVFSFATPRSGSPGAQDCSLGSGMIERARHVVRQNMASPEFGPRQLCRLLAVSRSKLYRLFEASGGVAAFIQRERLQAALAILSDARETRSINLVANDVGFPDHSTFSRAFRRTFGFSPSEAREMALGGQAPERLAAAQHRMLPAS